MTDIVTAQITASAVVVYGVELLKKAPWFPWIHRSSDAVNRTIAGAMAVGTALGIHMNFDAKNGKILITLTLASVAHGVFDWVRSFVFQEMIYKGVVKPHAVGSRQAHASAVATATPAERVPLQPQSQPATA